ncbi:hypothetical protein ALC62_01884 [Cyphomyrmex costatus]|uniref:Uncharacterized protein n=1 Tax=Cyphomyrmex costatus TaxID=456900 RepID=A0A151INV2_9HYME|nr:hypothetical protein ALC62_01884 [Cyphomyrmex costatus]
MYIGKEEQFILEKLENFEEKIKIMKNKYKLRGRKIYVDDDMTRKEREIQKKVREWAYQEKKKGRMVKVGYGKAEIGEIKEEGTTGEGNFWNVAGLKKKETDFWEFLGNFEIIGLIKTWIDEKEWGKLKEKMPKEWRWKCQPAERDRRRGRAKGGDNYGNKERGRGE